MRVGGVGLRCFGPGLRERGVAEVPESVVSEVGWGCQVRGAVGGDAGGEVAVAVGVGVEVLQVGGGYGYCGCVEEEVGGEDEGGEEEFHFEEWWWWYE